MTVYLAPGCPWMGSLSHFLLHLHIVASCLHVMSGLWSAVVETGVSDHMGLDGAKTPHAWPQGYVGV